MSDNNRLESFHIPTTAAESLTLRDHFAAIAMGSLLTLSEGKLEDVLAVSSLSYKIADDMLEERLK